MEPMSQKTEASEVPNEAEKAVVEWYFWDVIVPELTLRWAEEGRLFEVTNGWTTWTSHGWVDCTNYASDEMIRTGIDRWSYGLEDRIEAKMIEVGVGTVSMM